LGFQRIDRFFYLGGVSMTMVNQAVRSTARENLLSVNGMGVDYRAIREATSASLRPVFFVAPTIVSAAVRVLEFVLICAAAYVCMREYPGFRPDINLQLYVLATVVGALSTVGLAEMLGIHKLQSLLHPTEALFRLSASFVAVFTSMIVVLFIAKISDEYSRSWLIMWSLISFVVIVAGRFAVAALLKSLNNEGQFNRRAVIMGGGEHLEEVLRLVGTQQASGISILGFFDDREDARVKPEIAGCKKLGRFADAVDFVRSAKADLVIITLPSTAEARLVSIMDLIRVLPADIRLAAQGQKLRLSPRAYSYLGNLPCLDVSDRPLGDWGPLLKGIGDRIIALFAIILLSPLMLITACAVKLDSPGPLIFRQKRYGFNNELIEVFKFRSMRVDAADAAAARLVTKNDPRVTRVGRFIRKTSIDELPQLFNVLRGELSLVGPRPHATKAKANGELYERVVDGYFARHRVKPGITGWAQINGWRGETETEEQIQKRVDFDLYYIENWSLTFDLYILARTPLSLLNFDRAY
jgi:Undecaprenyl-phosphate glucose phosphotransferase